MKLQDVIDNNYVVELPQKWMFNEFCTYLGNLGICWQSGKSFSDLSIDRWGSYKEETCVRPSTGDYGYFFNGYTRVKFLDIEEFSFKVGDKVKVIKKASNENCVWIEHMDELIGTTGKITSTDICNNEYCVDDNYYFLSESLELIEKSKSNLKLKVGDKVKILGESKNSEIEWIESMDKYVGIESIISNIDYKDNTFEIEGCGYWFPFECLEEKSTIEDNVTINYQDLIGKYFYTDKTRQISRIIEFPKKVIVIDQFGNEYNFENIQLQTNIYQ